MITIELNTKSERDDNMIPKYSIETFRNAVINNIGKNITLHLKSGRRMLIINDCIIENAYSSIFVVSVFGESMTKNKKISVSYADLLTGNARISINNNIKHA